MNVFQQNLIKFHYIQCISTFIDTFLLILYHRWRAGDTVSSEDQLAIGDEARMDESTTLSQAPSFSNLALMADKPTAQLQVSYTRLLKKLEDHLCYFRNY